MKVLFFIKRGVLWYLHLLGGDTDSIKNVLEIYVFNGSWTESLKNE